MKSVLFLLVFLYNGIGHSQETFVFKNVFLPNSKYITTTISEVYGTINFEGDETMLNELKSNGMQLPMTMEQKTSIIAINETGEKDDLGNIPFTIFYEKMETTSKMNGDSIPQKENPFSEAKIFGFHKLDGTMAVDSITGDGLNEQIKSMLRSTFDQVLKQIDFPENPLKIGDTFTNEIPMTMPMGNLQPMEIIIKIDYQLKDIENNLALFDLNQNIALNSVQESLNLSVTGQGPGKLKYDIEKNIMVRNESTLPMKVQVNMPNELSMRMEMETKTLVTISME